MAPGRLDDPGRERDRDGDGLVLLLHGDCADMDVIPRPRHPRPRGGRADARQADGRTMNLYWCVSLECQSKLGHLGC